MNEDTIAFRFPLLTGSVSTRPASLASEQADLSSKTTSEIVEEIHNTFYTEVDRLLAEASVKKSEETVKNDLLDKAAALKSLGFKNTQEIIEAEQEQARLLKVRLQNQDNNQLLTAIKYFSMKYPNYKFITEESVKKICHKYGLVYGEVSKYKGTVPDNNLRHMLDFEIHQGDECWIKKDNNISLYMLFTTGSMPPPVYLSGREVFPKRHVVSRYTAGIDPFWADEAPVGQSIVITSRRFGKTESAATVAEYYGRSPEHEKCPLEIVAPVKDFDLTRAELKDTRIVNIPDPVVLKPVCYQSTKYYLIVTAWGAEASDELVVNQKMN